MIERIISSKLYRASSRKARIDSAMTSLANVSLVQQLASDLDEDYQTKDNLGIEEEPSQTNEPEATDEFIVNEKFDPKSDLVTVDDLASGISHTAHGSSPSSDSAEPESDSSSDSSSSEDTSELIPESPGNEKTEAEASESINNDATMITASKEVDITVLKGTLNGREDTCGVSRVVKKENEVWVYYNDEINLNNIMTDVIVFVGNMEGPELEFNRLARSDNAIVFVLEDQTGPSEKSQKEISK